MEGPSAAMCARSSMLHLGYSRTSMLYFAALAGVKLEIQLYYCNLSAFWLMTVGCISQNINNLDHASMNIV